MAGTLDRHTSFHWRAFAIYAGLGPPIGASLYLTYLLVPQMMSAQNPVENLETYVGLVPFSLLFSYLPGGVQAVVTGLIAGNVAAFVNGRVCWWTALLAPTAVGIMAYPMITAMSRDIIPSFALTLGIIGIAASLTLKLLFNRTFSTPQISHP